MRDFLDRKFNLPINQCYHFLATKVLTALTSNTTSSTTSWTLVSALIVFPTVEISYNQVLCFNNFFPQQDDQLLSSIHTTVLCDILKAPRQCGINRGIVRGCFRTEYGRCCVVVRRFLFCYANSAILSGYTCIRKNAPYLLLGIH